MYDLLLPAAQSQSSIFCLQIDDWCEGSRTVCNCEHLMLSHFCRNGNDCCGRHNIYALQYQRSPCGKSFRKSCKKCCFYVQSFSIFLLGRSRYILHFCLQVCHSSRLKAQLCFLLRRPTIAPLTLDVLVFLQYNLQVHVSFSSFKLINQL